MNRINNKEGITIPIAESILIQGKPMQVDQDAMGLVNRSFEFLVGFSKDKVIYGINTGFGPMAQYKVDTEKQKELQYNLIRSHSAGAGEKIPDLYVKASMLVRLRAIMQGKSGIHPSSIKLLEDLINKDVYPYIPEHGGVGASGDLVQLSHLALVLIGEGEVTYQGRMYPTREVFDKLGLKPIKIELREGLSLINGTSVMSGIALVNIIKSKQLIDWSIVASAMLNELVSSFDDHFSKELNAAKKHGSQHHIAGLMAKVLKDSGCISRRAEHFYTPVEEQVFEKKVQEYYSLRCIPQILGAVNETICQAEATVLNEVNSVSDNPIIDLETENVYHGGNFHGDYISLEMDKLKLAITRMSMLSERQLAFLFNPKLNGTLPPFVNLGKLGLNLGMQGMQFTATSTVAENQTLSNSMYVHSITTNNDNQDIVSMGTNSALLTKKVLDNAYQVQAIEMIALIQAIDYLKIQGRLSSITQGIYENLRKLVPLFVEDTPKYKEIEAVTKYLFETKINL